MKICIYGAGAIGGWIGAALAHAAIALLTRRRWLEWVTLGVADVGIFIGVLAFLHI